MTNTLDPDQTAVCSRSTLFAAILNLVSNARQLFAADHFRDAFFLGALRVNLLFLQVDRLGSDQTGCQGHTTRTG